MVVGGVFMTELIRREDQKIEYIQWLDAHSNGGWYKEQDLINFINHEDCIVEDIGWIVAEDDKVICLCARRTLWTEKKEKDNEYQYGSLHKIPKSWIKKRKILK